MRPTTFRAYSCCALLLLSALPLAAQTPAAGAQASVLLKPQRVFDAVVRPAARGLGGARDGRHHRRRRARRRREGAGRRPSRSTSPGMTLLPGLIDAHSHVFLHPYNETLWNDQVLKEPLAYRTIAAVLHCRATLMAGFTALRDLGTEGAGYADVSVKRAIDEGRIPGPRLEVATRAIVATASYGPGPRGLRARTSCRRRARRR